MFMSVSVFQQLSSVLYDLDSKHIYLKPKVTLHCYHICHVWVLLSDILNVFNSY